MLLGGSRRQEALNALNHLGDLDSRWAKPIAAGSDVVATLRALGAPKTC
jgi:hypothetical protein